MCKLCITSIFIVSLFLMPCIVDANEVYAIRIQGTINPPMASFVNESIANAEKNGSGGAPYPLGHAWRA